MKQKTQPTSVVTGAAGFLGSHLTDLLIARGHRVIGIDNFVTGSVDNIAHLGGNRNFKFIQQDVTEFIFLDEPVHYVWHFASPASPIDYLELPIQTLKVGSLGTHKALGLAKNKKARVLTFNTSGPRMRINDGRVFPAFISQAIKHKPVTVFGEGTQTRSFCYVSD